ncbi:MAG: hypothetical protein WBG24_18550 [Syntrophobacteria bacterium]
MDILTRLSTLIFLVAISLVGCTDLSWEPPNPGSVMAELTNPNKSLSARVIATEVQGTYIFEVREIRSGNILAEQTISAPIGYHEHTVWLTWSEDGRIVSATIDHDFGEGNKMFDLRIVNIDA